MNERKVNEAELKKQSKESEEVGNMESNHATSWLLVKCFTRRSSISWLAQQYPNCPSRQHATGVIWLKDVRCKGNESSLGQCPNAGWGRTSYSCDHTDDVCLVCDSPQDHSSGEVYCFIA